MTDYLEEVLEEETEDREDFRPRRAVVRASRGERQEPLSDEREKNERGLASGHLTRRGALLPGENGDEQKKRVQDKERETDRGREGESREKTEKAAESEDGEVLPELMPGERTAALHTEETAQRREDRDMVPQTETEAFPTGVFSAENDTAAGEALAEAERMALYAELADAFSEPVRTGVIPAWGESGREEAAAVLLRALGRTGRVSRTVRGGLGTAVVTVPGENAPDSEPDVESLDRLVRLDARRYDGGFQLF